MEDESLPKVGVLLARPGIPMLALIASSKESVIVPHTTGLVPRQHEASVWHEYILEDCPGECSSSDFSFTAVPCLATALMSTNRKMAQLY